MAGDDDVFGDARSVADFEELSRQIAIATSKLVVRLSRERDLAPMVVCGAVIAAAVRVAAAEMSGPELSGWLKSTADAMDRGDQAPLHGPVGHG